MLEEIKKEWKLFLAWGRLQGVYWQGVMRIFLGWAEVIKVEMAKMMYRQRGRFSQSFINAGMGVIFFVGMVGSTQIEEIINRREGGEGGGSGYLLATAEGADYGQTSTLISNLPKGEVTEYRVQEGDTVSGIARKFGVSMDTIVWENNFKSVDAIKPQQIIRILPVTGIRHKVVRGETIYSISKKYQVDAQNIIDYPFNTFANDETFALNAGQELLVPEGIKPQEIIIDTQRYVARMVAPIPGVVGEGNFMWPTTGHISQKFYWYHPAVDIANPGNPPIVASQGGTVITAGWSGGGYGNYVIIDHGNGFQTLYGHMLNNSIVVKPGDKVSQGQRLGTMGSTGRSTGTHLHFEIKMVNGGKVDPLTKLK